MVLVRRIRKRGANIVVEAHGEVLFAGTGDIGRWTNRFSQRVRTFAAQEAPTNKRPRWAHYGKPLKSTFTASTTYQPGRMRVYSAVGSSSPHAFYVDQGTGIHNGGSPYPAKVLPPWTRGSASLYEHTWRPGGVGSRKVKPVMIKGQKGQGFFDRGLQRGFRSMRMRSYQTPGDARVADALNSVPTGLENFLGNTASDTGFVAQLQEWRAWRDTAWGKGEMLGRNGAGKPAKPKVSKPKKAPKAKTTKPKATTTKPTKPKPKKGYESVAEKKVAAVAAFRERNPKIKVLKQTPGGLVVQTTSGPYLIRWDQLYNLLP